MCLSAEVDLVAGVLLAGVGADAVRHVGRRSELPLAVLPFVFAVHQLTEAVVWWGLEQGGHPDLVSVSVWAYLLVAFVLLPLLVPVAVGALEPPAGRERVGVLVLLGGLVAGVLLVALVRGPVEATVRGSYVDYDVDLAYGGVVVVAYVAATCGALLASAYRDVRWYGLANLVVVLALVWLSQQALISLWCAWAAVTSVVIAVHLRRARRPPAMWRSSLSGLG